jgi:hypothetical protein
MIKLPIYQNFKFFYEIFLDDIAYDFDFSWNEFNNTFLISMKKEDKYIFKDIALVPGVNFLKTTGIGELGILELIDTQVLTQEDPLFMEDFINRFQLIYISVDEL